MGGAEENLNGWDTYPDPGDPWPGHLREGAPELRCDKCGRKSWAISNYDKPCGMPQPDGSVCRGIFRNPKRAQKT
jgi:hypothetical protein